MPNIDNESVRQVLDGVRTTVSGTTSAIIKLNALQRAAKTITVMEGRGNGGIRALREIAVQEFRIEWDVSKVAIDRGIAEADAATPPPRFNWRGTGVNAMTLDKKRFQPALFIIPGLIPSIGVTLLSSKPKVGKSWLILDLAIAATCNTFVLGEHKPLQGDVLYLSLEDSERRLQARIQKIIPQSVERWPEGLRLHIAWPRVDEGGVEAIAEWIDDTRLRGRVVAFIAIDVLAMMRPATGRGEGAYDYDYRTLTGLKKLAQEKEVAIIIAHHLRKATAGDAQDNISGTLGIAGAADASIVIEATEFRKSFDVRGRDVESRQFAVRFNQNTCRWTILGDAREVWAGETRKKIVEILRKAVEPMTPKALQEVLGLRGDLVRKTLSRMLDHREVLLTGRGLYSLSPSLRERGE